MSDIIIAVGGSGARVVRSLMYLWAMHPSGAPRSLLPVFVDTDMQCGSFDDINNLKGAFDRVKARTSGHFNSDELCYFRNNIGQLRRYGLDDLIGNQVMGQSFINFIQSFGEENFREKENENNPYADLISLFYSKEELDLKIRHGFYGNPKIGSLVFSSIDFRDKIFDGLAQDFAGAESITVVGSLHGGTGSTGMMPILKALNANNQLNHINKNLIMIEPYYQVKGDTSSKIQSESFVPKSETAKRRYLNEAGVFAALNAVYIISGDYTEKTWEYAETEQKNPAHWIEFIAAKAIWSEIYHPSTNKGKIHRYHTHYRDEDIKLEENRRVFFRNIKPQNSDVDFWKNLAGFCLAMEFLRIELLNKIDQQSLDSKVLPLFVNNHFITSDNQIVEGLGALSAFTEQLHNYMVEIQDSGLELFNLPLSNVSTEWSNFLKEQNPIMEKTGYFWAKNLDVSTLLHHKLRLQGKDDVISKPLYHLLHAGALSMQKLFSRDRIIAFHNH